MGKHALSGIEATVGKDLMRKIQQSKILLVGSGGIGCELLKNLALSGFRHVETIDLDTIDVSNLNRQFLFRSQHVGMPKCTVACQVAASMAPNLDDSDSGVQYIAHHGNVCDNAKFNVQYVKQFNLVLNALDNVVARRRVNRLCLAADVPLIEAGTTGYLGQVKVIHKSSNVACYECVTQETQKVYPICTIRSTPSMPVHTIVWAKEFYKLLFGDKVEESMLYEDPASDDVSTYMDAVNAFRSKVKATDDSFSQDARRRAAQTILTQMFRNEIQKQLDMDRFKTAKKKPTPLEETDIRKAVASTTSPPSSTYDTASVWSLAQCIQEFTSCLCLPQAAAAAFDKDDPMAMRFVTAAANLRAHVFGIEPLQSVYSAKGIAGNIVPAIATTNAIVAGLQVLQAFHILQAQLDESSNNGGTNTTLADSCRYIDCMRNKSGRPGYYLSSCKLDKPNPKCFVCRNATIPLTINVDKWHLKPFLEQVVKKKLGFEEPTIMLEGDIIYEEGDGADTAAYAINLAKSLKELPCGGVQNGTILRIEDFSQDLEVDVCVTHRDLWEPEEGEDTVDEMKVVVGGEAPKAKSEEANGHVAKMPAVRQEEHGNDGDDDVEVIDMDDADDAEDKKPSAKRRSDDGSSNNGSRKKMKLDEVIVID